MKLITSLLPWLTICPQWMRFLVLLWVGVTALVLIGGALCILWPPAPVRPPPPEVVLADTLVRGAMPHSPTPPTPTPPTPPLGLTITKPDPNTPVEVGTIVEFTSPHTNLNHYILVTPLAAGTQWLTAGPLRIGATGKASGYARFGDGSNGINQQFAIQVVATQNMLPLGKVPQLPGDADVSPPVTVLRVK